MERNKDMAMKFLNEMILEHEKTGVAGRTHPDLRMAHLTSSLLLKDFRTILEKMDEFVEKEKQEERSKEQSNPKKD